jgi:Fur family ferric uptake transcriptional regulator
VKQAEVARRFEAFLREKGLRLTAQRRRILERAFATHAHFSAEELYGWLGAEAGADVSRATVYRTLALLQEGGFVEALDAGRGELVYEHVLGHAHHDHILCLGCGLIAEFQEPRIEALQEEAARRKGFVLVDHDLRLRGYCRGCQRKGQGVGGEGARGARGARRRGRGDGMGGGTRERNAEAEHGGGT